MAGSASAVAMDVLPERIDPPEQRLVVHGVAWKDYVLLRDSLDVPGLRMTFLEGALELMSPSPAHESSKKTIARLIEIYALERDIPLYGYGSTTFRREAKQAGAEPDECYVIGGPLKEFPDIALEVVLTSGGIDKLEIYARFQVPEVWFFQHGEFHIYYLTQTRYERIERSRLLPDLDFQLLTPYARRPDQHEAVREFRDRIRK